MRRSLFQQWKLTLTKINFMDVNKLLHQVLGSDYDERYCGCRPQEFLGFEVL